MDGLAAALVVTALVAANQRRWIRAILLAALAGSILPVMLIVVPVIVAVHVRGRRGGSAWQVAGRDLAEALIVIGGIGLAVPHGFGWITAADEQFSDYIPYSPANLVGKIFKPIVPGASFDDLAAAGRLAAIIAVVCIVGYLLVSARFRPVDLTAGYALLALALLAPDVHPSFVIWGTACIAPTALGMRRTVVIVLSAVAVALDPPGFSDDVAIRFGIGAITVGACVLVAIMWRDYRNKDRGDARAPARVSVG